MLKNYIDAAICRNQCDILLKNARYADVFCGLIREGDVAVCGDKIVGVGEGYSAKKIIDLGGKYLLPGFIDAHVHIESSQLAPESFARLVMPRGTTTVIADPHEIANVCGVAGIEYMRAAAKNTPLDVRFSMPSCVPATPFETSGATLSSRDISALMGLEDVFGLGEFMNYPGVIAGEEETLKKLEAAHANKKVCDGHAPSLTGRELNAYLCAGISTDHECECAAEAEEKISKGMYVMLRNGSSTHSIDKLASAVTSANSRRFLLCSDDVHAADLMARGHMDDALKKAVACGIDPVAAVTMATLNAAECYHLNNRGAIAPGYFADLAVVDDLVSFNVRLVVKNGVCVAEEGRPLFNVSAVPSPSVLGTVRIRPVGADSFRLNIASGRARAITVEGGSIVTGSEIVEVGCRGGDVVLEGTDLLKLAVVERHKLTGNIGKGLIKGYGFKGGALGISVSHDSHNLIIAGDDNACMAAVAEGLAGCGGGMAVCRGGKLDIVPLEIAGLMTAAEPGEYVKNSERLYALAKEMGVREGLDAFINLAFLALPVIPSLRLTDKGLFDVYAFAFIPVEVK